MVAPKLMWLPKAWEDLARDGQAMFPRALSIGRWGGPAMRAVVLVARPDVVLEPPSMYSPFGWLAKRRLEKHLGERRQGEFDRWQEQLFTDYMGLALDQFGILHLLALQRGSVLAEVKEELRQWPISDVKVAIKSDAGMWRVVEISDGTEAYMVLAPFLSPSRRAALRLIAESSGG